MAQLIVVLFAVETPGHTALHKVPTPYGDGEGVREAAIGILFAFDAAFAELLWLFVSQRNVTTLSLHFLNYTSLVRRLTIGPQDT